MKKKIITFIAVLTLISCSSGVEVTVSNSADIAREEMAELPWSELKAKLNLNEGEKFVIIDENGNEVAYQEVTYGEGKTQDVIFSVKLKPKGSSQFRVEKGEPQNYESKVLAHFVPERKDDFSWENDKVAFRMYGPALETDPAEMLTSGGIDIWVKSTSELVTKRWYSDDIAGVQSYHVDHGEGLDCYSVGRSLGAGAAAPYSDGVLYYISHNFKSYEILDNGPLRTVFRMSYEPYYGADSVLINETRTIEFDAHSHANKITQHYTNLESDIEVAAGFPYYNNDTFTTTDEYIAYALPESPKNGTTYLAVISEDGFKENSVCQKHLVGVMDYPKDSDGLTYYSVGGWSKGGFASYDEWQKYVKNLACQIASPLKIEIK